MRGIVHGESECDFDKDVHVEDSLTGGTHCNTYVHILNDTSIGRLSTPAKLFFLFSNSVLRLTHHGTTVYIVCLTKPVMEKMLH